MDKIRFHTFPRRARESLLGLDAAEPAARPDALRALPHQFHGAPGLRPPFEALPDPPAGRVGQASLPHPIARAGQAEGDSMSRIKVAEMAAAGHHSESCLKALFRDATGVPPAGFLRIVRLERAQFPSARRPEIFFGAPDV